jgi:fatty-acyl-CoA synthase
VQDVWSDPDDRIAETVGKPYPHTALKIAALDGGGLCKVGGIGEIRIQSLFMIAGYFDNPEGVLSAFDEEGFLRIGDLGRIGDDGYVRVTGRQKEMVVRGEENIYPREVEDALSEFSEVAEAAAFGIPDPKWGEELGRPFRPNLRRNQVGVCDAGWPSRSSPPVTEVPPRRTRHSSSAALH